jgi:hypothetical protein
MLDTFNPTMERHPRHEHPEKPVDAGRLCQGNAYWSLPHELRKDVRCMPAVAR